MSKLYEAAKSYNAPFQSQRVDTAFVAGAVWQMKRWIRAVESEDDSTAKRAILNSMKADLALVEAAEQS